LGWVLSRPSCFCYTKSMSQYVFILGHNPKLSVAEILAVLPQTKKVFETSSFFIIESEKFDCQKILQRLGGMIKIGEVIGQQINQKIIAEQLRQLKPVGKLNFGLSYYDCKKDDLGMEVKRELHRYDIKSRLVTSKDKILSSVVVTKNKCIEFLILENRWLAKTCAVQEFEEYSFRDYGRPSRDMLSGSMPPKLAKIMINLAQAPAGVTILDPFCGSGTILQEALLLGYKVIGSDISSRAIKDTKQNLEWLSKKFQISNFKFQIFQSDVRHLSQTIDQVDAIVTEPYLGPPLKGSENREKIEVIIDELAELYVTAFSEFRKILSSNGRIVIVFPAFRLGKDILELPILDQIKKLGFTQLNSDKLIYSRPDQKVWRQIFIWQ